MIYKFRAECIADVKNLLNELPLEKLLAYKATPDEIGLPDVEIEIELVNFTFNNYLEAIRKVEDGHVMLQTIASTKCYTGERNYDLI